MDTRHSRGREAARNGTQRLVRGKGGGAAGHGDLLVAAGINAELRRRARRIILALEATYGRPEGGAPKDPLSELIFTILSQNTNDTNRDRAWESMWRSFASWEAIASATRGKLERAIRVGGLAPTKSRVIQAALLRVR